MRGYLGTALAACVLAACTPSAQPETSPQGAGPQSFSRDMNAADRAACTSAAGRVERRGRMGAELCIHAYADAGKQCTDSAQCQGKCVSGGNPGTPPVAGQCQADDRLFGCYSEIKGGKSVGAICID
jgi:hypothetical protein